MKTACPRCGADVVFKPSTQKCYCEYCGSEIDISEFNVDDFNKDTYKTDYNECTCSTCGASLIVDENTTITRCVYCGSNQIIKNRFRGEFNPDKIIPFKIDNEKFVSIYKNFIKKKILAPNEFRNNSTINEIKGMYVPFHIFTIDTNTYARGEAYKRSNKTTYYKYFETEFDMKLRSPQDASTKLDDDIMTSLEPFNFNDEKDFNPVYLNGFSAENGNENIDDLAKKAKLRSANESAKVISKKLRGYKYNGGKEYIREKEVERNYSLLPVWFFNTNYKNKKYSYALNGQTGKVVGQIPLSKIKFGILMIAVVIVAIYLTLGIIMGSATTSSRHRSDDEGPGGIIAFIWIGVASIYIGIKSRYRNVRKVLDNPLEHLIEKEKKYNEYSRREYNNTFGNDDYKQKEYKVIDEDLGNELESKIEKKEYSGVRDINVGL